MPILLFYPGQEGEEDWKVVRGGPQIPEGGRELRVPFFDGKFFLRSNTAYRHLCLEMGTCRVSHKNRNIRRLEVDEDRCFHNSFR